MFEIFFRILLSQFAWLAFTAAHTKRIRTDKHSWSSVSCLASCLVCRAFSAHGVCGGGYCAIAAGVRAFSSEECQWMTPYPLYTSSYHIRMKRKELLYYFCLEISTNRSAKPPSIRYNAKCTNRIVEFPKIWNKKFGRNICMKMSSIHAINSRNRRTETKGPRPWRNISHCQSGPKNELIHLFDAQPKWHSVLWSISCRELVWYLIRAHISRPHI